eukprot:390722-Prymnesium_polylepis.1
MLTIKGHITRKRPLSKRLLFLDLQVADIGTAYSHREVIIKEDCGGVGGSATARSVLKVGDLVNVEGEVEAKGSLLAKSITV